MRLIAIILTAQVAVWAAPAENTKETNPTLANDQERILDITQEENSVAQSQRQKRWYNYYGYGFPPVNPIIYPTKKRDNARDTGNHGAQGDPFTQIYTRLQEIAQHARQPAYAPPPQPPQIPIFFPVIFIPQIGCGCTPGQATNGTSPGIFNRFPVMDDTRQNWGFVVNGTDPDPNDPDYVDDSIRPVDFVPVSPDSPTSRPAPPVEHGSSQEGNRLGEVPGSEPPALSFPSTTINPFETVSPPTACDGAILSCCHQLQVTYECFTSQGCQNPTESGDPCGVDTIKLVIDRFQRYYSQRN